MWLLDWLVSRWNLVTDWFSDNYWTLKYLVSSIPNTISNVYNYIAGRVASLISVISTKINEFYHATVLPLSDWLYYKIQDAKNYAKVAYDVIQAFIAEQLDRIDIVRNDIISWVSDTYNDMIFGIGAIQNYLVDHVIPDIINRLSSLFDLKGFIDDIKNRLNIPKLSELQALFEMYKNTITAFVTNPLGFMLGILWTVILKFLEYVIGYSLGTTKYDLPPLPNWNDITKN